MAEQKETKKYIVLCWGACEGNPEVPCCLFYTPVGKEEEVHAPTGDVISDIDPKHVAALIANGILAEHKEEAK